MFRILVVDDSPTDVWMLQHGLKSMKRPCQMDWVKDGSAAFDYLYRRGAYADVRPPHLILLDMNMPCLNGLEVLSVIKSDPELSIIPVIMLSSSISPAEVRLSYQAHANGYLQKPTTLENLTRLVRAIEAFWMDLAVLPFREAKAQAACSSNTPGAGEAGGPRVVDCGRAIASETTEMRSRAIENSESVAARVVPERIGCEEYHRLLDEFGVAVHELLKLHEEQVSAITQGDGDCSRFDLLIHMASEKKQLAKYAYIRHVESHGCANYHDINQTRT